MIESMISQLTTRSNNTSNSQIRQYQYYTITCPVTKQKIAVHFLRLQEPNDPIVDAHYYLYKPNIRILMKANTIRGKYEMNNYSRFEYNICNNRWQIIFETFAYFQNPNKQLIKAYIYGHFNEQDEFVQNKMKVVQGTQITNLEKLIKKQRLLPQSINPN